MSKGNDSYNETKRSEIITNLQEKGKIIDVPVASDTKETPSKITITEDVLRIFAAKGMKLIEEADGKYYVILPDGTKQELNEENTKLIIKNGVKTGTYLPVEGVRKTTEYEKKNSKGFRNALILLVLVGGLFTISKCANDNIKADDIKKDNVGVSDERPSETESVVTNDDLDHELAYSITYGNLYKEICDLLEPASVVRDAQDAAEAIDYDMELMGGDLCKYEKIQHEIVNPGATFIEQVQAFKEKYANVTFNEENSKAMIAEAELILNQYNKWLDTVISLCSKHAETTKQCIDKGIRVEDYTEETKVTLGQISELDAQKIKLSTLLAKIKNMEQVIQDIKNGNYIIGANNEIIFMTNDETLGMSVSENLNETEELKR